MKLNVLSTRILFGVVLVLGFLFVLFEIYLFSPELRGGWVSVLEQTGNVGWLARMLEDSDAHVCTAAGEALVRQGTGAVQPLVRELERGEAGVRHEAALILGRIGPPAMGALPALQTRMEFDVDAAVRQQAARAVGQIVRDDPAQLTRLVRAAGTGDARQREVAEWALSSAVETLVQAGGEEGRRAVPFLVRKLRSPSKQARLEATEALEVLGPLAQQAIPALIEALGDKDARIREEARETLERVVAGGDEGDADLRARGNAALGRSEKE